MSCDCARDDDVCVSNVLKVSVHRDTSGKKFCNGSNNQRRRRRADSSKHKRTQIGNTNWEHKLGTRLCPTTLNLNGPLPARENSTPRLALYLALCLALSGENSSLRLALRLAPLPAQTQTLNWQPFLPTTGNDQIEISIRLSISIFKFWLISWIIINWEINTSTFPYSIKGYSQYIHPFHSTNHTLHTTHIYPYTTTIIKHSAYLIDPYPYTFKLFLTHSISHNT